MATISAPTEKQTEFVKKLLAERAGTERAEKVRAQLNDAAKRGVLTKRLMSNAIEELKAIKVVGTGPTASPIRVEHEGFYFIQTGAQPNEGDVFWVKRARESGNLYASKLVPAAVGGRRGSWSFLRGGIYRLAPEHFLTLDRMAEIGRFMNVCLRCGAWLEDERSVRAGFGPTCAKKMGVPWG